MDLERRRVIGIDPGYGRTGVGVVESHAGRLSLVGAECIETSADLEQPARLAAIQARVEALIALWGPLDEAAVELLYFGRSTTTAMRVAEARGVVLAALGRAGVPVSHYTPMQIKGLTGSGRADKRSLAFVSCRLLGVERIPGPDDAADAVAAALWHLAGGRLSQQAGRLRQGGREKMSAPLRAAVRLALERQP